MCCMGLNEMHFLTLWFCGAFLARDSVKKGQPEQKVRLIIQSVS